MITANDAEGAGEAFIVTTRSDADYEADFFGKKACLTVSGQLHVEPYALAFGNVYSFGPTFRAENSNTPYHASEFWMIEPEIASGDLFDNMNLIEDMIKYFNVSTTREWTFFCPQIGIWTFTVSTFRGTF